MWITYTGGSVHFLGSVQEGLQVDSICKVSNWMGSVHYFGQYFGQKPEKFAAYGVFGPKIKVLFWTGSVQKSKIWVKKVDTIGNCPVTSPRVRYYKIYNLQPVCYYNLRPMQLNFYWGYNLEPQFSLGL